MLNVIDLHTPLAVAGGFPCLRECLCQAVVMPKIPCEKKKTYKARHGYRKQWEVQCSLSVLYRCLFCKLGQQCIPWKDLKEPFSIEVQQCIYFNTHSYTVASTKVSTIAAIT